MTKPKTTPTAKQYRPFTGFDSKVTIDQLPGLEQALHDALMPLAAILRDKAYWAPDLKPEATEYRSRDGFIPFSHNCGGMELRLHVPLCEQYEFSFLEFGECDECGQDTVDGIPQQCGYKGQECASESEDHLDAYMRIWLKFEGLDSDGLLNFYLVMEGGNGDAPYFRSKYLPTLFEASFTCRTLKGFKRASAKALRDLAKVVQS